MRRDRVRRHARLRSMKWDLASHTSSRSLTHPAGNLNNKPAARNDHTTQPETEPALNRFALKPLVLGEVLAAAHAHRPHHGRDRASDKSHHPGLDAVLRLLLQDRAVSPPLPHQWLPGAV